MKNSIWLLLFLGAFAVAGIYWYYGSAEKNQTSTEPSVSETAKQEGVFVPNDPPPVAGGLPGARDERPSYPTAPPQNAQPQSPPANQYPGYSPPPSDQGFQPPPAFDAPQYEPPPYEPPPYDQIPPPPPPQKMDEFDNDPVSPPPPMEPPSFGGEGDYQSPPPMEDDL